MPLFEYHCPHCGAEFEKLVSASQRDDVVCSACGAARAERRPSTFAAKSAGSGGARTVSAAPKFT